MYRIKPSNRFKKDVRLAQKRGYRIDILTDIIKSWQMEKRLIQNIGITSLNGIIKAS